MFSLVYSVTVIILVGVGMLFVTNYMEMAVYMVATDDVFGSY